MRGGGGNHRKRNYQYGRRRECKIWGFEGGGVTIENEITKMVDVESAACVDLKRGGGGGHRKRNYQNGRCRECNICGFQGGGGA